MVLFFSKNCSIGKKELVDKLIGPNTLSPGYTILEYRVVGDNIWYLYSRPSGTKSVGLYLLEPGIPGSNTGWGYKAINEDDGPCQLDCPFAFIEKADPPESDYAREWRDKIIASRKAKKEKGKALRPKLIIRMWNRNFKLLSQVEGTTNWLIQEIETGNSWTLKKAILVEDAEILEEKKEAPVVPVVMATEKVDAIQAEMFA